MNFSKIILAITVIFMMAVISCGPSSQKVDKAKENLKDAQADYHQSQVDSLADYMAFKQESEAQIDSNELVIADLKARMKADKKKYKDFDQKRIDELEQKNINMREKIKEYKEEGKDEWIAFKQEFRHDMKELGDAIKGIGVNHNK